MHKLFKVLALTLIATALALGNTSLFALNQVRLEPVVKPVVDGDSVAIKVYVTNEDTLSAFSLGFSYFFTQGSSALDITSMKAGPGIPAGSLFKKTFKPATNQALIGFISLDPEIFIEPSTDVLVATMYMKVPLGTGPTCINLDSAFVPPAGYFMFSPKAGGSVTPDYQDGGLTDINIAGGCDVSNTAPVVDDIPGQAIAEGGTFAAINLDNYVADAESADNLIVWTATSASPNGFTVTIDPATRIATIGDPNVEVSVNALFTFTATDPDGLTGSDTARFTVTAVNDAPVVADIPNQNIAEGGSFATISLDNYVADPDNADNQIGWTATSASPNGFTVTIDPGTRIATVGYPVAEFAGTALFTFTATDPGPLPASDTARFTVTPVNDPPTVAGIPDQSLAYGAEFATINLDSYVTDPDNSASQMTWTYSGNSQLIVSISPARVATITKPSATWSGSEAIIFTATDPGGLSDSDTTTYAIAAPGGVIKLTPDTLTFSAYTAGANPTGLPVMVTNIGTGALDWTASDIISWLSLSSSSGTAPSGFNVNISITGLTAGTYTGAVSISSAQANNSPKMLVVILNVHNPVDIKLTPDSLGFYARQLGANPGSQSVSITNGSPSGIAFEWGAVETAGWLALSATTGTVPSSVTFSVDIAGLTPGDYSTLVIIEQLPLTTGLDGVNEDIDTVKVTLKVDTPTGVDDNEGALPSSYNLAQNYPNPFNPSTVIEFNLPTSSHVTLTVFNILGQKVTDILDEYMTAGSKSATWNGKDVAGKEAESGVYFYRLTADSFNMTRKMMLLK